jgi:polyhydroxyalkanoate synthase
LGSSGGHIAGIVNPPSAKAWYETAEANPQDAARWRQGAARHDGSWWQDWAAWADARAGRLTAPPPMGGQHYPALGPAPGDYVRG